MMSPFLYISNWLTFMKVLDDFGFLYVFVHCAPDFLVGVGALVSVLASDSTSVWGGGFPLDFVELAAFPAALGRFVVVRGDGCRMACNCETDWQRSLLCRGSAPHGLSVRPIHRVKHLLSGGVV